MESPDVETLAESEAHATPSEAPASTPGWLDEARAALASDGYYLA